jgi:hypothetical protein
MKKFFIAIVLSSLCVFYINAFSCGFGFSLGGDFGGGVESSTTSALGESFEDKVKMPQIYGGFHLSLDLHYIETSVGIFAELGLGAETLSDQTFNYGLDIGAHLKFPFDIEDFYIFPLLGITYQIGLYSFDSSMLWLQFGVGLDFDTVRFELLYGFRPATAFERDYGNTLRDSLDNAGYNGKVKNILGHGLVAKITY